MSRDVQFLKNSTWKVSGRLGQALDKLEAEREFDKLHGPRQYKVVDLDYPITCETCGGKGMWLEPGDAHRSEGWAPCPHQFCRGGKVFQKRVEIKRRIRVKANSQKV